MIQKNKVNTYLQHDRRDVEIYIAEMLHELAEMAKYAGNDQAARLLNLAKFDLENPAET